MSGRSQCTSEWTNDESSRTKLSIVEKKYFCDKFVKELVSKPLKRTPEINRGYYARLSAIQTAIVEFVTTEGDTCAVVNVGAGFDTLFFRLKEKNLKFGTIVDVDTEHVIMRKMLSIEKSELLKSFLSERKECLNGLHSRDYHLIGCDVTRVDTLVTLLLNDCHLSPDTPTLFLFECLLLYLNVFEANTLLRRMSETFTKCSVLAFDLIQTNDKFSHLMQKSLQERDTPLLGARSSCTNTLDDWSARLRDNGFATVFGLNLRDFYDNLEPKERQRVESLEFLDEKELLTQLLSHYCLVCGNNFDKTIKSFQ